MNATTQPKAVEVVVDGGVAKVIDDAAPVPVSTIHDIVTKPIPVDKGAPEEPAMKMAGN